MFLILADVVGILVSCGFISYLWQRRSEPFSLDLAAGILCTTIWMAAQSLGLLSTNVASRIFWVKFEFFGIVSLPIATFVAALTYYGSRSWLTKRNFMLLWVIPIATLSLVWTNDSHQLFWRRLRVIETSWGLIIEQTPAMWHWVHTFYSYGLIAFAIVLLLLRYRQTKDLYQWQAGVSAIALIIPILANIAYQLRLPPKWPDLTAPTFCLSVLLFAWLAFRFHILNVIPVAQRTVFENLKDVGIILNHRNLIVDYNHAALALFKLAHRNQAIGHKIDELSPWWGERIKACVQSTARQIEFVCVEQDGIERWLTMQATALPLSNKPHIGTLVMIRDITAEKQSAKELARAYNEAIEAAKFKSQLLAKVSHELRNPLGVIVSYAELLQQAQFAENKDKRQKASATIVGNARFLAKMVNDLLESAQLEAGKLQLQEVAFSITEVLEYVYNNLHQLAIQKGIIFTYRIDPQLPSLIVGDPDRVAQILLNLAGNAIKFTETGCVQINLSCVTANQWAIQVVDTGPGIPNEAQGRIFEPFQQLQFSHSDQKKGYGLGLSIVQQLIQLMRGEIKLESEVGRGSAFTITLPLNAPSASHN